MIRAKLDTREFDKAVRKLWEVGTVKLDEVIKQSAGLVIRDCVRYTPPFGNAPITEGFASKKKVGQRATELQIRKIYKQLSDVKLSDKHSKAIKVLSKKDLVACADYLRRIGIPVHRVISDMDSTFHRKARNNRGHVRWSKSKGKVFIVKNGALKKYINSKKRLVGQAMSGWSRAVAMTKAKGIGKWALKSFPKTKGTARRKGKGWHFQFEAANLVPYGKGFNSLNITKRAVRNQTRNLIKRIDATVKYTAKRSGF